MRRRRRSSAALAATGTVSRDGFLAEIARWTPDGLTRDRLRRADQLGLVARGARGLCSRR